MICQWFVVSGRVQGVCFRASTCEKAQALGLVGHAVNRADGRVEVLACGEIAALETLQQWLHHGPRMACVEAVTVESMPDPQPLPTDFHIG
ncbi:MAG TPA: acylphosphatase [Rhodanobacteraceae bacterium]